MPGKIPSNGQNNKAPPQELRFPVGVSIFVVLILKWIWWRGVAANAANDFKFAIAV